MSAKVLVPVERLSRTAEVDVPDDWEPTFSRFAETLFGLTHLSRARTLRHALSLIQFVSRNNVDRVDLDAYEEWDYQCRSRFNQSTYLAGVRSAIDRFCRYLVEVGLWCGPTPARWASKAARSPFRSRLASVFQHYVDFKRKMGRHFKFSGGLVAFDRHLLAYGVRNVDVMTNPILVRDFVAMRAHLAQSTRAVQFGELRGFFRYLGRRLEQDFEPVARELPYVRRTFPEPRIYTIHELKDILEWLRGGLRAPKLDRLSYSTAIHLIYGCGLRRNEAVRLKVEDVDFEQRLLRVRGTKFGKDRLIPVGPRLLEHLRTYAQERIQALGQPSAGEPFFVRAIGMGIRAPNLLYGFRQACRLTGAWRAGQARPRLHDLRHTFAVHRLTRWYLEGDDPGRKLVLLSIYMGHVEPEYTQHYLHLSHDLLRVAGRPMERAR